MTAPDPFFAALRKLNSAAYAVIRACRDTTECPDVDRQALRQIARMTDDLVDNGGRVK